MASVIGTGSAALLKAIASPLHGWKREQLHEPGKLPGASERSLSAIVEGDFIPRLMMRYSNGIAPAAAEREARIDPDAAEKFAVLPLRLEADELLSEVENFLRRGISVEAIFVDLLAPSARRIGQLWEEDACDFVDVTMGLWRLQEVMREIAARTPPVVRSLGTPRSALFSPLPGDQHGFGTLIIDEMFARAGWESEALIDPNRRDLLRAVSAKPFDLIGLTITSDCPSGPVSQLISAIRSVSANSRALVLIGGRAVNANADFVGEVGADGTAVDAAAALKFAADTMGKAELNAQHAS